MSMIPHIIITAPHSLCNDHVEGRNCDTKSQIAAQSLYDRLPYDKTLFLADVYRNQIDLNRPVGRKMEFRENLTELLNDLRSGNNEKGEIFPILFDIHSVEDGAWDLQKFIY